MPVGKKAGFWRRKLPLCRQNRLTDRLLLIVFPAGLYFWRSIVTEMLGCNGKTNPCNLSNHYKFTSKMK
jgi:hypothetical protein